MKTFVLIGFVAHLCYSLRVFDNPGATIERNFQTEDGPVTLIVGAKQGRSFKFGVPKPFEVRSEPFRVKVEESDSNRRGRQIETVKVDEEHVPVIEGVREPDDPNDKRVFRNARVINNILITDLESAKNEVRAPKSTFSSRQGRIMNGGASVPQSESPIQYIQSPNLNQNYDPDRTGPVDPNTQTASASHQDEKIVSYTYSTSVEKGEKKTSPRDVVYGSGFASEPSKKREDSPPSFDSSSFPSPPNSHIVSFQPSITWSDFHSASNQQQQQQQQQQQHQQQQQQLQLQLQQQQRQQQHQQHNIQGPPWSPPPSSSSQFRFPSSNSVPNPSPSFERSPVSSNKNFNNQIGHSTPSHYQPGDDFSNWVSHIERHAQKQNNQGNVYSQHPNSPPVQSNHIRRHHQPEIPTPHHAFGQAGENLIHPNIIPVNSQNFVIEEATFQTRPGTPAFSLPVPRPVSQVQHVQPQVQQGHQQYYTQPNNYYQGPYYYQDYYEELDNRPLIDKMIDPLRKVGQKVKQSVIKPVLDAGQKFGNRLRIPERVDKIANGNVDADALPLVGGAVAVATLGALGAYAASKYSFTDIRNLLPTAATRSTKSNANVQDVLLKLANDLENEDPSFIARFTSSTSWLESSCAQRIFCTLVTTTMREEEEKIQKEKVTKEFEKRLQGESVEPSPDEGLKSRVARKFLEKEVGYLERQMNNLINSLKVDINGGKNNSLRKAANDVVEAIKNRNCASFTCTSKH